MEISVPKHYFGEEKKLNLLGDMEDDDDDDDDDDVENAADADGGSQEDGWDI